MLARLGSVNLPVSDLGSELMLSKGLPRLYCRRLSSISLVTITIIDGLQNLALAVKGNYTVLVKARSGD